MNQQEKAQLAALAAFKEQAAKEARKAKIEREIAKYSNKATQRAIKHNMMALDLVEDVENTWNPVCEGAQAQEGIVIRADNLDQANQALNSMTDAFKAVKNHLQWEIDMQIIAATSEFKWNTVHQVELSKQETRVCSMDDEAIRKHEKERISWEKDLRAAKAAAGSKNPSTPSKKRKSFKEMDGDSQTPSKKRSQSTPGKKARTCYRCGKPGHIVKDCDKDFAQ